MQKFYTARQCYHWKLHNMKQLLGANTDDITDKKISDRY